MSRRLAPCRALVVVLLAAVPFDASAQAVLGPQDDALTLPRGALRIRVLNQWARFNERFGVNTPGRPNGALEPLAVDFNLDTIGVAQFPRVAPVQAGLRQLTGITDFTLSLGRTVVNSEVSVSATPIVAELGLTSRFSVGVVVPFVRTKNEIFFDANPEGFEGNVGFNPALASDAARTANANLVTAFTNNANALEGLVTTCTNNPTASPSCPAVRANGPALVAAARQFSGGIAQLYGINASATNPFVPIENTTAQLAIESRVVAFSSNFQAFGLPAINGRPTPAQSVLTVADAQRILTEAPFGVSADPLETIERSHIGDIEIGGKFLLFDTFVNRGTSRLTPTGVNFRASVGGIVRLGTGQPDSPRNFVDVGTGNGQTDVEFRAFSDVLIGRHFWTSFIGRYGIQMKDENEQRIFEVPEKTLTASYRQQVVERDLGDYYELEANPRWVLNDYFSATAHYMFRHKFEDSYSGTFLIPGEETGIGDLTLNANTLNQQTEMREHRLGGGVSFSTVAAFQRGKMKIPLEVTYFHYQTTRGSGGNQPKIFSDQIQLRVYTRLFGG